MFVYFLTYTNIWYIFRLLFCRKIFYNENSVSVWDGYARILMRVPVYAAFWHMSGTGNISRRTGGLSNEDRLYRAWNYGRAYVL